MSEQFYLKPRNICSPPSSDSKIYQATTPYQQVSVFWMPNPKVFHWPNYFTSDPISSEPH